IWIAGRWPNESPFRRAARFDGVMPTHDAYGHDGYMRPAELAEIVGFVRAHRSKTDHFDVVLEGHSEGPDELHSLAPAYADAGMTWWVEKLGWWRGDRSVAVRRVDVGV